MSHPFAFEVLVSAHIDDLRSEAKQDYLVALTGSAGARKSPVAPIAWFLKSRWSRVFCHARAAAAANF
jgi:hypothetical protein